VSFVISNASLGKDSLPYKFYKEFVDNLFSHLASMFTTILPGASIPQLWLQVIIRPFTKVGKDPTLPKSYRPMH